MRSMALVPSWLYYLFAVLMLAVAAHGAVLLGFGTVSRRTSGWDVELSHALMGVAMAGMFVGEWTFGPSGLWASLFAALLVWFVISSARSVLAFGPHLPHTAVHALMSFAMLLMYWFPGGMGTAAMSSMTSSHPRADPGLLLVVAVLLLASAIFTLASERRGAVFFGTHVTPTGPGTAIVGTAAPGAYLAATTATASGIEGAVSRPWLLDTTHIVMCVAMSFLLILML